MDKTPLLGTLVFLSSLSAFGKVDNDLLSYLPSGTKVVASVDVQQARSSPFGQYILQKMKVNEPGFQEFVQQTGFDPRQDIQEFIVGSSYDGPRRQRFVVLARGTFDQDKLAKAAREQGSSVQMFQGATIYLNQSRHQRTGFTFLDTGIAAMGDISSLQQVISARANPQPGDPQLQQLISRVGQSNDAWFVSLVPGDTFSNHLGKEMAGPLQNGQVLQSVLTTSGGIHFGDSIQFSVDAQARSPKDASALADVARLLSSTAQMYREKNPHVALIAPALNSMTLAADGDTVHLSLSLPEQTLEQLSELKTRVGNHPH